MDINQAMQSCHKRDIKIYPIFKDWKWYICKEEYGKKKVFDKPLQEKEVNRALEATYLHYAK